jgi:hypothetical protein
MPVTPSATTSGTDPRRRAITGVPQAMASTMTRPNGSSQRMGTIRQRALASSSFLVGPSASPIHSTPVPTWGRMTVSNQAR